MKIWTELIVLLALFGVVLNIVRLLDFLKFLGRFRVIRLGVGMVDSRQLAIRLADLVRSCRF